MIYETKLNIEKEKYLLIQLLQRGGEHKSGAWLIHEPPISAVTTRKTLSHDA